MLVDSGRQWAVDLATGNTAPEDIVMGLYTNAVTWSRSTVLGDLTIPSQTGYAPQTAAGWSAAAVDGGGIARSGASSVTFSDTDSTPIVAVGFYYYGADSLIFLGGDAFSAPLTIPATTGTLTVQPRLAGTTYP